MQELLVEVEENRQYKVEFEHAEENRRVAQEEVYRLNGVVASFQDTSSAESTSNAKQLADLKSQLRDKIEELALTEKQLESSKSALQSQHNEALVALRSNLEQNAAEERAELDSKLIATM